MNTKRLLLLGIAVVLVWYAFFRKTALPQKVVVKAPVTTKGALNDATAQTLATVTKVAQPYIADWTGSLLNGIATSVQGYGQGGSSGADTGSTSSYGEFESTDESAVASGTGGEF